jgi:membrane protein YdbS with pleckstrin-like domain
MATFWRYVHIQSFVFLCGIVAPIFLVVFFAVQPEPDTKWLYWAGLFITAADVLIALGITNASVRADTVQERSRQVAERG